jgi:hypothetical protein
LLAGVVVGVGTAQNFGKEVRALGISAREMDLIFGIGSARGLHIYIFLGFKDILIFEINHF